MKKEILFAVIIGLGVGLIITFGIYRATQAMKKAPNNTEITQESATPVPQASNAQDAFSVVEPADDLLTSQSPIRISGQTYPNAAIVVLSGNQSEIVSQADGSGNFSFQYPLQAGSNILIIRSLSTDHDPLEVIRTVVYSSADLTQSTASQDASPSPTPSSKKVKPTPTPTPGGY